jgi:hypothetical protein
MRKRFIWRDLATQGGHGFPYFREVAVDDRVAIEAGAQAG